jgi:hypothetical protein
MQPFNYDRRNARAGPVALVAGGIVLLLLIIVVSLRYLYLVTEDQVEYDQVGSQYSETLRAIQARENEQLYHYAYIDKSKGIVRLPIDRAMELLLTENRGLTPVSQAK